MFTAYIQAEGYVYQSKSIPPGEEALFELKPARRVSGRVEDASGKPVPGAYVFEGHVPYSSARPWVAKAVTGADGRFVLHSIAPRTTQISAAFSGLSAGVAEIPEGNVPAEAVIRLSSGTILEVSLAYGNWPIDHAGFRLLPVGQRDTGVGGGLDENGQGRLEDPAPGAFRLRFYAYSHGTARGAWTEYVPIDIVAGETARVEVALPPLVSSVEGYVVKDGLALSGVAVHLDFPGEDYPRDMPSERRFRTKTDDNGAYVFDAVPEGPARIGINGLHRQVEVHLPAGQRLRQDLVFTADDESPFWPSMYPER